MASSCVVANALPEFQFDLIVRHNFTAICLRFSFAQGSEEFGFVAVLFAVHKIVINIKPPVQAKFYNFKSSSVTAPSEALVTWAAYFASTPRV